MFYNVQTQLSHCIIPTRIAPIKSIVEAPKSDQDPLAIYRGL